MVFASTDDGVMKPQDDLRPKAALADVAVWLGYPNADAYNAACEMTPVEVEERLRIAT